jgi:hypothetical protein
MALCDFLITADIAGYGCENPASEGVDATGYIVNRADYDVSYRSNFLVNLVAKCGGKRAYKVVQPGKTPFNGTQQEMVEGANQNTITNTVQIVVLKQDENWAQQLFALMNGEFIVVLSKPGQSPQVYGAEAGLHCTGAVRELYNDDTLEGWQITFTEEGASRGNLFMMGSDFTVFKTAVSSDCPAEP